MELKLIRDTVQSLDYKNSSAFLDLLENLQWLRVSYLSDLQMSFHTWFQLQHRVVLQVGQINIKFLPPSHHHVRHNQTAACVDLS